MHSLRTSPTPSGRPGIRDGVLHGWHHLRGHWHERQHGTWREDLAGTSSVHIVARPPDVLDSQPLYLGRRWDSGCVDYLQELPIQILDQLSELRGSGAIAIAGW